MCSVYTDCSISKPECKSFFFFKKKIIKVSTSKIQTDFQKICVRIMGILFSLYTNIYHLWVLFLKKRIRKHFLYVAISKLLCKIYFSFCFHSVLNCNSCAK